VADFQIRDFMISHVACFSEKDEFHLMHGDRDWGHFKVKNVVSDIKGMKRKVLSDLQVLKAENLVRKSYLG